MIFHRPSNHLFRGAVVGRSALVATTILALAGADVSDAERRCLQDPVITGRTCSAAECVALQDNVNSACKNPAPSACGGITGCTPLRQMKARWLACYETRIIINARCWKGGDPSHQFEAVKAIRNIAKCDARIALPEPVGCADPCPQFPGAALARSSTTPGEGEKVTPMIEIQVADGVASSCPEATAGQQLVRATAVRGPEGGRATNDDAADP